MAITQGTTCCLPLRYEKIIPEGARVEVMFNQPGKQLTKSTDADGGVWFEPIMDEQEETQIATRVYVDLTQEETLGFDPGNVEVQLRYIDAQGTAKASGIALEKWARILKKGVIQYE